MEKRVALYGFLVVLAVGWNASLCNAEPRKITEAEKNFCAEAYRKYCSEYGLESAALRNCMDRNGRAFHIIALKHSSMPVKSLEVRWNVARKAVSEIPVASSRPKRRAFNASTLRLLEELCEFYLGHRPRSAPISGYQQRQ